MASDGISFFSVPKRYWKSFVPAWLALAVLPFALLGIANSDSVSEGLHLYFWLILAPVLAVALWPLVRLRHRKSINHIEFAFWILAGTVCVMAVISLLHRAFAVFGL